MNPAHKQRLVGAIVLVALGLIIIPAVLDFSRDERADMKGVEVPPGPDAMQMEVLPLDEWSQKVEPGIQHQPQPASAGEAVESSEPPEPAPDQSAPAAPAAVPEKSEPKPVSPAVTEKRESKPAAAATAAAKPAPAPVAPAPKSEIAAKGEGWVVQVISLTVEARANAVRDQLRKAGYPAFVEKGKSGGNTIYRVKAGPVAQRAEADELKKAVKQTTKLDGLIMQNR